VQEESEKQKCHQDILTGDAAVFTGSLLLKKVGELQDIAYTSGLKEEGKKDDLLSLIKSLLDSHPELCTKLHFAGLYGSCGQKRHAPSDENVAPPSNRP
jgi:hypothetical protein